jgi:hypothetical protein
MAPGQVADVLAMLRDFLVHRQVECSEPGRFQTMKGGILVFFRDPHAIPFTTPIWGYPIKIGSKMGILRLEELGKHSVEDWHEFVANLKEKQ